jgi:uncharacterized protein YhbP (UPF0306 family)
MNVLVDAAKRIIAENIYMTVATASLDGRPWISPVFFAYDENYNLFWVSSKESVHSKLIRQNPRVAIVIFNSQAREGDGDGVYFEATASELHNVDDIKSAVQVLDKRTTVDMFRIKSASEVIGDSISRIYKASPHSVSKLTEGQMLNGQYVDKRVDVDLR